MRSRLVAAAALTVTGGGAALAGPQFTADAVQTQPGQEMRYGKLMVGEKGSRFEFQQAGQPVVQIVRPSEGRTLTLYPLTRTYVESKSDVAGAMPDLQADAPCKPSADVECKKDADQTGLSGQIERWTVTPKSGGGMTVWWDAKRKMTIRQEMSDGRVMQATLRGSMPFDGRAVENWEVLYMSPAGQFRRGMSLYAPDLGFTVVEQQPDGVMRELRNVQAGAPDAKLFDLPEGYQPAEKVAAESRPDASAQGGPGQPGPMMGPMHPGMGAPQPGQMPQMPQMQMPQQGMGGQPPGVPAMPQPEQKAQGGMPGPMMQGPMMQGPMMQGPMMQHPGMPPPTMQPGQMPQMPQPPMMQQMPQQGMGGQQPAAPATPQPDQKAQGGTPGPMMQGPMMQPPMMHPGMQMPPQAMQPGQMPQMTQPPMMPQQGMGGQQAGVPAAPQPDQKAQGGMPGPTMQGPMMQGPMMQGPMMHPGMQHPGMMHPMPGQTQSQPQGQAVPQADASKSTAPAAQGPAPIQPPGPPSFPPFAQAPFQGGAYPVPPAGVGAAGPYGQGMAPPPFGPYGMQPPTAQPPAAQPPAAPAQPAPKGQKQ